VTINQGSTQSDPTSTSPVVFDVVFSDNVTGFTNTDVDTSLSTATLGAVTVTPVSASAYTVSIVVTGAGSVIASVSVGAATDSAGNTSAASTSTDNTVTFTAGGPTDTTPPTITITTPPNMAVYIKGQVVNANYGCSDASGVASCVGTVANGTPIDTATVGAKTFTVNALDNAGNPGTASVTYYVKYNFTGFFSPVNNTPTLNTSKAGQAIPVKFKLGGNQGLNVFFDSTYPKERQIACDTHLPVDAVEETLANPGNSSLSYDAGSGQYNFVWKTDKGWVNTCRQIEFKFNDGQTYVAWFKFVK
jgi:hypothetical protein